MREEGRSVLGLAVQNTLVQMLERDTGIPSMTVARFLRQQQGLLEGADQARLAEARASLRGTTVLLDEASMVGNADKEKLVRLANLLELGRFASIGDRKQLGAVDAGKPFDVMQQAGIEMAVMNTGILAIGAVLASFMGTTGASMLLIRPWIRMNKYRITGHHIVFFIFIVHFMIGSSNGIVDSIVQTLCGTLLS